MKKGFYSGFLAGLLTTALVAGFTVTALAAGRTITVDDGIQVTFNGAAFIPKDAQGNPVPVFSYNGTTYAPVRALCEAAGLTVRYDSGTRTAQITGPVAPTGGAAAGLITEEQAKTIALNHAGVSAGDATFFQVKLERHGADAEYEVEFYSGSTEYDYEIDAATGEIRSFDHDAEGYQIPGSGTGEYISAQRAQEIALAQAPAGTTVVECKMDRENGRMVYELELRNGRTEYECEIDASTGAILSWDAD